MIYGLILHPAFIGGKCCSHYTLSEVFFFIELNCFFLALFAKNPDSFSDLTESCKKMAAAMSDTKQKVFDLTLPIVSYFNGRGFNEGIIDCIGRDTMINELILNFFCTSTDLCRSAQVIHTKGLCWKYVRASMSLHGYLVSLTNLFYFHCTAKHFSNVRTLGL